MADQVRHDDRDLGACSVEGVLTGLWHKGRPREPALPPAKVHLIAAARPNFMKVAPLWHALAGEPAISRRCWSIPASIMTRPCRATFFAGSRPARSRLPSRHRLGQPCRADRPGDDRIWQGRRSAPAGLADRRRRRQFDHRRALVGAKLGIPTVHLEAGLRSRDRTMPEELNRLATDAVSDVLWTPSPDADRNLLAEGMPAERITRVGNIMLDSFERSRPAIVRPWAASCHRYIPEPATPRARRISVPVLRAWSRCPRSYHAASRPRRGFSIRTGLLPDVKQVRDLGEMIDIGLIAPPLARHAIVPARSQLGSFTDEAEGGQKESINVHNFPMTSPRKP